MKNKFFFFGDYQGWRYTDGGSKLLDGAHGARAHGQPERVRRQHLRPA